MPTPRPVQTNALALALCLTSVFDSQQNSTFPDLLGTQVVANYSGDLLGTFPSVMHRGQVLETPSRPSCREFSSRGRAPPAPHSNVCGCLPSPPCGPVHAACARAAFQCSSSCEAGRPHSILVLEHNQHTQHWGKTRGRLRPATGGGGLGFCSYLWMCIQNLLKQVSFRTRKSFERGSESEKKFGG